MAKNFPNQAYQNKNDQNHQVSHAVALTCDPWDSKVNPLRALSLPMCVANLRTIPTVHFKLLG